MTFFTIRPVLFLASCLGLVACGLFGNLCEDCGSPRYAKFRYLNQSEHVLTMVTSHGAEHDSIPPTGRLEVGDSLEINVDPDLLFHDSRFTIHVRFESTPERCLVFTGPILDLEFDIRSDLSVDWEGHRYRFTKAHFDSAGACQ
jgi:hypothetical protein